MVEDREHTAYGIQHTENRIAHSGLVRRPRHSLGHCVLGRKRIALFLLLASYFSLLTSIFTFCGYAQEPKKLEIKAQVDKDKVNIGDRIRLELSAGNASGMEVWFPEKPENLGDFSLFSSAPSKKGRDRAADRSYVYVLGIYSTGTHVIPPIQVRCRKKDSDEWFFAASPQVPIEVETLLVGDPTDIKDLKGIVTLRSGYAVKALLLTLLALLAALGIYVWKKGGLPGSPHGEPPRRSADEVALEELRRLKAMDLPAKGAVKEYYVRLSDIVRRYLENRFSFRAPEMTTEEFLDSIKGSQALVIDHRHLLEEFLSHCDMVKFAKYGPAPIEMLDSYNAAEKLVLETKAPKEEGAE